MLLDNNRIYQYLLKVATDPQWHWSPPVPIARYIPVVSVLKPVVESFFFDKFWHPFAWKENQKDKFKATASSEMYFIKNLKKSSHSLFLYCW